MTSMNGMSGLGGKPIKVGLQVATSQVSVAVNKMKDGLAQPQAPDHAKGAVGEGAAGHAGTIHALGPRGGEGGHQPCWHGVLAWTIGAPRGWLWIWE